MKKLGRDIKRLVGWAIVIWVLYLLMRYWPALENMVGVAIDAGTPLIIGCVMAYVINILMNFYEKWYCRLFRMKVAGTIRRIVCMILAFLTLIGIIALIINLVLPELINCIASFIRLIPGVVQIIVNFLEDKPIMDYLPIISANLDLASLASKVETLITSILSGFGGAVGSILTAVSSMVSMVVSLVIGLIFAIYLLLDKEKLATQGKLLINTYLPKKAEKIFYILKVLNESFHNFIVGQCTEAVVLGVLCMIGMMLFKFPYAVMIGAFIGFTALIPIAGAYIGACVGAVMILTESPIQAVEFLIFIVILQQLEGNLIYPRVVGQSIGLPGIWVLTAVTIGGGVMGIPGMMLAVPLFAATYRLIREDVERRTALEVVPEETPPEENVEIQTQVEETDDKGSEE